MTLFEFLAGMISVILALAVAQLFLGLAGLVQSRAPVRYSVTQGAWIANLFVITFLHWWSLWDFRDLEWHFPMFFFSLLGPSLLFFAATLVSPRESSDDVLDLGQHFLKVRRPLMGVVLVMIVLMTLDGPLFGTEPAMHWLRIVEGVTVGSIAASLVSKDVRVHLMASLAVLAITGSVVVIRFFPLQM